jgi:hypothetical protein
MGFLDSYGPQGFADRGGMLGRLLSLRPDLASDQQRNGELGQGQSVQAPGEPPSAISASAIGNALDDFYRQSILKPGRDIAGYVHDAINDPAYFAHAIGPSLGGLGPVASQLPGAVKSALGAIGLAGREVPDEGNAGGGSLGSSAVNDFRSSDTTLPGDKSATTPVGRRGEPIAVKPGTNRPTAIGGRTFTGHAGDQMQGRGVPPSAVEDAIRNGATRPGNGPGETVHIGSNGVIVVTGSDGQVITVITGKP